MAKINNKEVEEEDKIIGDLGLDITTDVSSQREAQMEPGITEGFLVEAKMREVDIKTGERKGSKAVCLTLRFRQRNDAQRFYNHNFISFNVPSSSATPKVIKKFDKAKKTLTGNIKHIIEAYTPFTNDISNAYFKGVTSIDDLLNRTCLCLNGQLKDTDEAKPIFKTTEGNAVPVYLKLVYPKTGGAYLGFPYSFPFIEKVRISGNTTLKSTLTINPQYDLVEPAKGTNVSNEGTNAGGGAEEEFPIF